MWTSNYYGYWDYWELRHKITFDGINKLMLINPGVTNLNVKEDIYSDWKEWQLLETEGFDNSKYATAIEAIGGQTTTGNETLDVTYFLLNGWKLKPYPGSYDLVIDGNIFDVDGEDIKVPANIEEGSSNNITITRNTSVIVRAVTVETGGSDGGLTTSQSQQLTDVSQSVNNIDGDINEVSSSLSVLGGDIIELSGSIVEIKSILQSPVTASLETTQQQALFEIQAKVDELHKIHGLQTGSKLTVTGNERKAGDVTQSIDFNQNTNTTIVERQ